MSHLLEYTVNGSYVDWGSDSRLFVDGDMSVGLWVNMTALAAGNDYNLSQVSGFPPMECQVVLQALNGYGVSCLHEFGGGGSGGVLCVPGAIDPMYKLNAGTWMYFGFSRVSAIKTYFSWFGSRNALIDGQTATYVTAPVPQFSPAHFLTGLGIFNQGNHGTYLGPWTYWQRALTKAEHEQLAKCIVNTADTDLLLFCKMDEVIEDLSSYAWVPTIVGDLPFLADSGCTARSATDNYRLYAS